MILGAENIFSGMITGVLLYEMVTYFRSQKITNFEVGLIVLAGLFGLTIISLFFYSIIEVISINLIASSVLVILFVFKYFRKKR